MMSLTSSHPALSKFPEHLKYQSSPMITPEVLLIGSSNLTAAWRAGLLTSVPMCCRPRVPMSQDPESSSHWFQVSHS